MTITSQQAHVLANINRVVPLQGKLITKAPRSRYQLDGVECTAQIVSLGAAKLITKHSDGGFRRLGAAKPQDNRVGKRQAPLASSLEAIKASLAVAEAVRTGGIRK